MMVGAITCVAPARFNFFSLFFGGAGYTIGDWDSIARGQYDIDIVGVVRQTGGQS